MISERSIFETIQPHHELQREHERTNTLRCNWRPQKANKINLSYEKYIENPFHW